MKPRAMLALAVVALARPAAAETPYAWSFELDGRYERYREASDTDGLHDVIMAGLGARGAVGSAALGLAAGLDVHVGAGVQGGFAYDIALYPLGIAAPIRFPVRCHLLAGAGTSGVTEHLPATATFPVELALQADVGWNWWLGAWFRPSWVTASARRDGAELLDFADELEIGVALRLGKGGESYRTRWGNGLFVGAYHAERLGTSVLGFMIGHALDAYSVPGWSRPI
jgi:hypothetical protein